VATIPSGETYHRVRTGPYADQAALDKVRDLLKRNGKDAMTIPVK
jgi:cell division protein FtsN